MNKVTVTVLLVVVIASLTIQTGDAFLRNGKRDAFPARREGYQVPEDIYEEYYNARRAQDTPMKKRKYE